MINKRAEELCINHVIFFNVNIHTAKYVNFVFSFHGCRLHRVYLSRKICAYGTNLDGNEGHAVCLLFPSSESTRLMQLYVLRVEVIGSFFQLSVLSLLLLLALACLALGPLASWLDCLLLNFELGRAAAALTKTGIPVFDINHHNSTDCTVNSV